MCPGVACSANGYPVHLCVVEERYPMALAKLKSWFQRAKVKNLAEEQGLPAELVAVELAESLDADASFEARKAHVEKIWAVPPGLVAASNHAWRILVVGVLLYFGWLGFVHFEEITVPVCVSLLLTAALWPFMQLLVRLRIPRVLAASFSLLMLMLVVGGLFTLVGMQLAGQWGEFSHQAVNGVNKFFGWLQSLAAEHFPGSDYQNMFTDKLKASAGTLVSSGASWLAGVGISIGHFLTSFILVLFTTFFFLYEGDSIARSCFGLAPEPKRSYLLAKSVRGWSALVHYVRAVVIVALFNGVFTALGAFCLGSPLFFSVGALTFLMAFIPLLGSFISGFIACLVVLVTLGWAKSLAMLIIYVVVIQVEGNILHPFLLGKAVDLHPLLVLLGIGAGVVLYGVIGALFIVPVMAFFMAALRKPEIVEA